MIVQTASRIEDVNTVINSTTAHRSRILVSSARNIKSWFSKVRKIKAIYCTLNLFNFDVTQKCLIAECWCPVTDLDRIRASLAIGTSKSGAAVPSILNRMDTDEEPPTFNRTNKITQGFQVCVSPSPILLCAPI
jgi:V-type H+-transporting ATPase subunit a